ncbi:hypothetical protein D9M69_591550 [compost metagenome]
MELKRLLAPAYTHHGRNEAVRIEHPHNAADVARYAPKEAFITERRLLRIRADERGSSAHRASQAATEGGREGYKAINEFLYGNPFQYAGLPDFS